MFEKGQLIADITADFIVSTEPFKVTFVRCEDFTSCVACAR